ncbi:MAG: HAD family hydrolase, partial [Rhodothermaceae bacterium]|nr:HAD family hydrolase [Rhodothermaceae bacterium]
MDQVGNTILDRFSAVLLDMNSTFMFDEDRFGPEHDYAATYQSFGGALSTERADALIVACYERLDTLYLDPARHDSFPTVKETLRSLPGAGELSEAELERLEQTFAAHELGRVPEEYAAALKRLAATHRLALVADVWAQKEPWLK